MKYLLLILILLAPTAASAQGVYSNWPARVGPKKMAQINQRRLQQRQQTLQTIAANEAANWAAINSQQNLMYQIYAYDVGVLYGIVGQLPQSNYNNGYNGYNGYGGYGVNTGYNNHTFSGYGISNYSVPNSYYMGGGTGYGNGTGLR